MNEAPLAVLNPDHPDYAKLEATVDKAFTTFAELVMIQYGRGMNELLTAPFEDAMRRVIRESIFKPLMMEIERGRNHIVSRQAHRPGTRRAERLHRQRGFRGT